MGRGRARQRERVGAGRTQAARLGFHTVIWQRSPDMSVWISVPQQSGRALTGLLGVRSSPGVVFSACFHLPQSEFSLSSASSPSFLPPSPYPSPLAWPPPPRSSVQECGAGKAASVPTSAAGWQNGMLGESHLTRQAVAFNPLHTRPQQVTTCR